MNIKSINIYLINENKILKKKEALDYKHYKIGAVEGSLGLSPEKSESPELKNVYLVISFEYV